MSRILGLTVLLGAASGAFAADATTPTLDTVNSSATPAVTQRVREEMHQALVRLATTGALGAHPEQLALDIDEPAQRSVNLGLLVDATNAANARDGLRVLGTTPGSTAERLGVHKAHFTPYGPPPALLQDVLGKEAPAVRADGLEVRLPGKSWSKQLAIIADAPVFSYFDLDEQPAAIVGLDLLRNSSLAIDFAGQRLYLGPTVSDGS